MPKNSLTLDKEFLQYCKLNNIEDIEGFAYEVFRKGFVIVKYGERPAGFKGETTVIEKEVIVEKIVEVNKEIINNDEIERLTKENKQLKEELDKFTSALDNMGKRGKLMKDSNLSSLYDE
jgi:hypothetical protein